MIGLLILFSFINHSLFNQNENDENNKEFHVQDNKTVGPQEENTKPEPRKPESYTATISAIGDILAHSPVYKEAYIGNDQYDFTEMFTQVRPYIERADITVANSESIIGGQDLGVSSYPLFNSPYELADTLKAVGVDVVNMANNHTLDRGEQAILNATNHWNELGITYVGVAKDPKESRQIKTMTVNKITFSFLSYTYGTNGLNVPEGKDYLVNYINEEKMIQDIQKAKEISDLVVLNLHVGEEYSRTQNDYQEKLAQLAADNGVHIIFAHHPHVLQPVKWYTGIEGNQTFVIHSLGNFLSSQDKLHRQIGTILELEVSKTITYGPDGQANTLIEVKNPRLLPTYVKFSNWKDFEIIPMYQLTSESLPNAASTYEEIKKHMSQYVPTLEFIES
ncbi:CapA family protein [Ureibacillus aquaedulcis]|uniref:CapA family protein n=1 Tax=Ureibacillus aquaedulcis TaxID=3058421 RepID=A0ABT8GMB7_9BACL|nr:CapA family protein [Ureibacillus sp. BA0131]MDN4492563.1 CapA family protein [Ureibacillus sp. BA0131]